MFKENGREKPAENLEVAHLRGKQMSCPKCGELFSMAGVRFTGNTCEKCGGSLIEVSTQGPNKATGKE